MPSRVVQGSSQTVKNARNVDRLEPPASRAPCAHRGIPVTLGLARTESLPVVRIPAQLGPVPASGAGEGARPRHTAPGGQDSSRRLGGHRRCRPSRGRNGPVGRVQAGSGQGRGVLPAAGGVLVRGPEQLLQRNQRRRCRRRTGLAVPPARLAASAAQRIWRPVDPGVRVALRSPSSSRRNSSRTTQRAALGHTRPPRSGCHLTEPTQDARLAYAVT